MYLLQASTGANFGIEQREVAWVESGRDKDGNVIGESKQTSMTGGSVDINVEGKTTLKGAVIASDTGDLNFVTGSFEYEHIKDKDESFSFNIGGNLNVSRQPEVGTTAGGANDLNGVNDTNTYIGGDYGYDIRKQTNFATVGEGNFVVLDDSDISGLNRDVTLAQYETLNLGLNGAFELNDDMLHPGETINEAWENLKDLPEGVYQSVMQLFLNIYINKSVEEFNILHAKFIHGTLSDDELVRFFELGWEAFAMRTSGEAHDGTELTSEMLAKLDNFLLSELPLEALNRYYDIIKNKLYGPNPFSQFSEDIPSRARGTACSWTTSLNILNTILNRIPEAEFISVTEFWAAAKEAKVIWPSNADTTRKGRDAYYNNWISETFLEKHGYTLELGKQVGYDDPQYNVDLRKAVETFSQNASPYNMYNLRVWRTQHTIAVVGSITTSQGEKWLVVKDTLMGGAEYLDKRGFFKIDERTNRRTDINYYKINYYYPVIITPKTIDADR